MIYQMDVDTALFHADIQEEIYFKLPEGSALPEGMNCFRLNKELLHGLKQSPREWYSSMAGCVLSIHSFLMTTRRIMFIL